MRVGVNSGGVMVREIGGDGHVAYPSVGDTVNTGARLESLAPVGGVLIGSETYLQLPAGAVVEERAGLRMKGKDDVVDAYVLHALPLLAPSSSNSVSSAPSSWRRRTLTRRLSRLRQRAGMSLGANRALGQGAGP